MADPKLNELKKITAHCIKYGIVSIEFNGIKLNFASYAVAPKQKRSAKEEPVAPPTSSYTDEEMLMWSSAGIPDSFGEQ